MLDLPWVRCVNMYLVNWMKPKMAKKQMVANKKFCNGNHSLSWGYSIRIVTKLLQKHYKGVDKLRQVSYNIASSELHASRGSGIEYQNHCRDGVEKLHITPA